MSPLTFQFSILTTPIRLVDRSLFPIFCSPFSLCASNSVTGLSSNESASSCVDLLMTL